MAGDVTITIETTVRPDKRVMLSGTTSTTPRAQVGSLQVAPPPPLTRGRLWRTWSSGILGAVALMAGRPCATDGGSKLSL